MQDVVQSVDRTLSILEVLSDYEDGLGLIEISSKIGLHKSTVHRLLSTLIYKGYVEQNTVTNKYKLTLKLFELGHKRIEKIDVLTAAKPYLHEIMEKTNEVVHLVIRDGNNIVYIDKVESENTIRMHSSIGRRSPMYCTGVGKVMMAYVAIEEACKIWQESDIEKLTPYTITDWEKMKKELENIREKGYALDEQENEMDVRCIAAPIFNYKGEVCAAVSISGPIVRISDEKIKIFSKHIVAYSSKISKELGYN